MYYYSKEKTRRYCKLNYPKRFPFPEQLADPRGQHWWRLRSYCLGYDPKLYAFSAETAQKQTQKQFQKQNQRQTQNSFYNGNRFRPGLEVLVS
jgi:hypothetical protein